MEFALGAAYDQLKQPKDAIAAYQRAADMEPGDLHTLDALAQALLNDNQLDEALKQFKQLAEADPENTKPLVHIGEIQRRQGKYEDALATIRKARKKDPTSLEAGYNEGLLLDVLGRFDEAAQTYEKMVDLTSHANGAYTAEEKNNRGIFLERLGAVYHEAEQDRPGHRHLPEDDRHGRRSALRGYEGQVDTYGDAKMFDKAVEVCPQGRRRQPQGSRSEADAGRNWPNRARPTKAWPWPRGCSTTPTKTAWSGCAGPVLHRDAPLEGCRRRLAKADSADHQEGRPHLPALPQGRAGRAAEAL
jgi:tetratricopeptide (TPR) repeat protein